MKGIKLLLLTIVCSILSSMSVTAKEPVDGYIFIGDSRTVGMDIAVSDEIQEAYHINFVAKVGAGYKWLTEEAVQEVNKIMLENTEVDNWLIITNFGVNDLRNATKYRDYYKELLADEWSDVALYYLSVNPVDESKCNTVCNTDIESFNELFCEELNYINTYNGLLDNIDTKDGLHYSNKVNYAIYNEVINQIEELRYCER